MTRKVNLSGAKRLREKRKLLKRYASMAAMSSDLNDFILRVNIHIRRIEIVENSFNGVIYRLNRTPV